MFGSKQRENKLLANKLFYRKCFSKALVNEENAPFSVSNRKIVRFDT